MKVKRDKNKNTSLNAILVIPCLLASLILFISYKFVNDLDSNTNENDNKNHNNITSSNQKFKKSFYTSTDPYSNNVNHSSNQQQPHHYPEGTANCHKILSQFRKNKIKVAENTNSFDYRRSFVVLSNTPNPFYVATHDAKIDDTRAYIFIKHEYYEKKLSSFIQQYFDKKREEGKESIFVDVGANIGWFSLLAASHGASKVYAFEPNLQNMIRFCESLSLNRWLLDDRSYDDDQEDVQIIPITKGVGETEEQKTMYAVRDVNPGTFSFNKSYARRFPVKDKDGNELKDENGDPVLDLKVIDTFDIITLDSFAESQGWFESKPSIGILKIDVEKFEKEVFEGGQKLLKSHLVEMISFELKGFEPTDRKQRIIQILVESGYDLYMHGQAYGPNNVVEKVYDTWQDMAVDFEKGAKVYGHNLIFRRKTRN